VTARTVEWLVYTCLLGLIPVAARLLVWSVSAKGVEPVAISDLVAFGLVLHSANIHEVGRLESADRRWTAVQYGISITFIVFYALLMFTTILSSDNLNQNAILRLSIAFCVVSFLLSISVLLRAQAEERGAT
jgi:hypothetical protein